MGHPHDAPPGSPWETHLPVLRPLIDAGQAIDARLGVDGLPQSATGQASWLTGENAAARMGHHYGPRPGPTLRPLLERSLPVRLARAGARVELLNYFPPPYFVRERRSPHGCFPLSFLLAGRTLNPDGWPLIAPPLGLGFERPHTPTVPVDDIRRQGEAVGHASMNADLLVLDLWFSDFLGHEGGPGDRSDVHVAAREYLRRLDALLTGVLETGARVVISSDHGNFEDLGVKTHTYARVPFAGSGVELPRVANIAEAGEAVAALVLG